MASNKDINLTIRAQDNTQGAIEKVVGSLVDLQFSALKVGDSVEKAESQVKGFSKVLDSFAGVSDKIVQGSLAVESNIRKIGESINGAKEASLSRLTQMGNIGMEIAQIENKINATREAGGDKGKVGEQLKGLNGELREAEVKLKNLTRAQVGFVEESARLSDALKKSMAAFKEYGEMERVVGLYSDQAATFLGASKTVLNENKEAAKAKAEEESIQRLKEQEAAAAAAAKTQQRNDKLTSLLGVNPNAPSPQQTSNRAADVRAAFAEQDAAAAAAAKAQAEAEKTAAAAAKEATAAIEAENAAIEKFRNSLDPVKTAIANLSAEQERLDNWFMRGKISEQELQEGSEKLSAKIAALRNGELGLADSSAKAAQEQDKLASAAQRWRDILDPVAPVLRAAAQQEKELAELEKQGLLTTEQATAARARLAKETERLSKLAGGRYKFSLFGLEGYETNNLMYQINDIISGFAMGQSPFQILAQQGGQVFQLFQNKLGPAFNRFKNYVMTFKGAAVFSAISAAVFVLYENLSRATEKMENLRRASAFSSFNVDIKASDVGEIAKAERSLEHLGVTGTDAMNAIAKAKELGLNTEAFTLVESAAKSLSIAFGVKLKDSVVDLSKAFSGNVNAIEELDKKYNFLSAAQAKHIRDLIEEGENQKAGAEAVEIFNSKMSETAIKMEGSWAFALRSFKEGWNDFWDGFSNLLGIDTFIQKMEKASYETRKLKAALKGEGTSDSIQEQIDVVQKHLNSKGNGSWLWGPMDEYNDKEILKKLNQRKKEADGVKEKAKTDATEASNKALDDVEAKDDRERPSRLSLKQWEKLHNGSSEGYVNAGAAKIMADKNRELANAGIDTSTPRAKKIVDNALSDDRMKRQETVNAEREAAARKRESAAKRAQQMAEQYKKTQESLNLAVEAETEKLNRNYEIREKTNNKTGAALILTKEELELQDELLEFQKRVDQANLNLKPGQKPFVISEKIMSEFKAAKNRDMASRDALSMRQAQMSDYDKPVKALEQQRERLTQLIQTYSALGQNGVVGEYEKQLLDVTQQLKKASENADRFYAAIEAGGEDSARSFGLTMEQVTNIRDGLQKNKEAGSEFGKEFLSSGKAINEELAGGLSSSFVGFADSIAQGNSALTSLKNTFLSFANLFLTKMVEMVAKQYLFNNISGTGKGGTGESGVGGGIMGFIARIFGAGGSAGAAASASSAASTTASAASGLAAKVTVVHGGGEIGASGGLRRYISSNVFRGARKFHKGTLPGLSGDEIPAILQKGEHVLTAAQQRSLAEKAHSKSDGNPMITNITAFNDSDIAQAMAGAHGTRVIMNMMTRNQAAFKQILR